MPNLYQTDAIFGRLAHCPDAEVSLTFRRRDYEEGDDGWKSTDFEGTAQRPGLPRGQACVATHANSHGHTTHFGSGFARGQTETTNGRTPDFQTRPRGTDRSPPPPYPRQSFPLGRAVNSQPGPSNTAGAAIGNGGSAGGAPASPSQRGRHSAPACNRSRTPSRPRTGMVEAQIANYNRHPTAALRSQPFPPYPQQPLPIRGLHRPIVP